MAQMTSADVTYTSIVGSSIGTGPSAPARRHAYTILFPNGANTNYPSGGIPLVPGKVGCPANIMDFIMMDEGSSVGYVPKYDYTAQKIRLYVTNQLAGTAASTQVLSELTTADTVASTTLKVLVSGW